jgi:hypothetical protein
MWKEEVVTYFKIFQHVCKDRGKAWQIASLCPETEPETIRIRTTPPPRSEVLENISCKLSIFLMLFCLAPPPSSSQDKIFLLTFANVNYKHLRKMEDMRENADAESGTILSGYFWNKDNEVYSGDHVDWTSLIRSCSPVNMLQQSRFVQRL